MRNIYLIFIIGLIYNSKIIAQQLPKELPIQTQPLQGPGIQRVGSAPIPIQTQNLEQMVMPSFTLPPRGGTIQPSTGAISKRMPYDSTYMSGRIIFLNGVNISSVKNQDLENVTVRIDKNGNINIEAPQYEVGVEQSYHPMMPNELPKFPKNEFSELPVPKGKYSKETGKPSTMSPMLPKEFAEPIPQGDQSAMSPQNKTRQAIPQSDNAAMPEQGQGDSGNMESAPPLQQLKNK
ncbi:hypothetical protein [Fluviispira multicolorata]|uniref:Uncharacterized protein n=1 Tax=Fluviispira multicolorata TaxID=2654512 RepID=A0A833JB46_9BACT|nr:hypothetical protein [Fluviispira multicolorata]KAB8028585.1 hypothetical protein GCL57_12770 [Fluviispira multicolorata]